MVSYMGIIYGYHMGIIYGYHIYMRCVEVGANQGIRMNAAQPIRQTQSSSHNYCKYFCIYQKISNFYYDILKWYCKYICIYQYSVYTFIMIYLNIIANISVYIEETNISLSL